MNAETPQHAADAQHAPPSPVGTASSQAPLSAPPGQSHELDRALALSRVGGDTDMLREIAELFLADYPNTLEKIRSAVAARDAIALEQHAHSLKGSVSTFGAENAFNAALKLERQGRCRELASIEADLNSLEQALCALRPELETLQS